MDYEGAPLKGQPVPVSPQAPAAIKHEWPEASCPNPCGANEVVANLTPNLKNGLIWLKLFALSIKQCSIISFEGTDVSPLGSNVSWS